MTPTAETHFTGHKFRVLNDYFWKNLENSTVYFAKPCELNDPFDCQIDLMKAVRLAKAGGVSLTEVTSKQWQKFANMVTEPAAKCGVFSLCAGDIRGLEERLLWAHYAQNHSGVCITYEIPYSFVETLIGFGPVAYGEEGLLDALRPLDLSGHPDFEASIKPVITNFLTTKSKEWAYEKEARFVSFQAGVVPFERDWLRQICFGINTPKEDRAKVIAEVKKHGYTKCQFTELFHSDGGLYELVSRVVEG